MVRLLSVFTDGSASAYSVHASFVIPGIKLTKCFVLPASIFTAETWAIDKSTNYITIKFKKLSICFIKF